MVKPIKFDWGQLLPFHNSLPAAINRAGLSGDLKGLLALMDLTRRTRVPEHHDTIQNALYCAVAEAIPIIASRDGSDIEDAIELLGALCDTINSLSSQADIEDVTDKERVEHAAEIGQL